MKPKTLLATASLFAVTSALAHAETDIRVVGNGKVDAEFVASAFPDKKRLTQQDYDQAIKDLFATGAFSDVKVTRDGKTTVVTVSETPVVVNVVFNGNRRLSDARLAIAAGLDSGTPFEPSRMPEISARIAAAYATTGRRAANVTPQVVQRDGGFYDVTFDIDEGDRSQIGGIWFEGNASISSGKLKSVMDTKPSGIISKLFSKDVIDDAKLEADRRRIEAFYRSRGFADVVVSPAEVDFDEAGKVGMAGFRIEEGRRYTVGTVRVSGVSSDNPLASALARKLEGRSFDPKAAASTGDAIASELERAGQIGMDVTLRTNRLPDGRMDVEYAVDPMRKAYVERLEIVGNLVTKDYVIRRAFDLSEGDLYNPRLVREAERRLNRLGFFESVSIATAKGSADDRIVVKVEVVERKTGEFSVGGGYSTTDGPMAMVSLSQSNFGGTGRTFSVSVGQGTETGNYDLSFTEPYLFGNRLSGTVQVFRRDHDRRDGGFRPYDETVDGAKFTLKGPISDKTDLAVYYSISTSSKDGIDGSMKGTLVPEADHVVSSVGWEWGYVDLDDEKNPTEGLKLTVGQQLAGIGGDARFIKNDVSIRTYSEISERHEIVGSFSARAGSISSLGRDLDFSDHYRTAGELVRGFENGGIGPRDTETGYLLGGRFYAGASAEAVYPIPVLSDAIGVKGSVFADLGTVFGVDKATASSAKATVSFDDASIRSAIGTGLVWDSPVGLFKANFALPLSKEDGDRTQVFSISGGTRF